MNLLFDKGYILALVKEMYPDKQVDQIKPFTASLVSFLGGTFLGLDADANWQGAAFFGHLLVVVLHLMAICFRHTVTA
jgi:hypothetical protein